MNIDSKVFKIPANQIQQHIIRTIYMIKSDLSKQGGFNIGKSNNVTHLISSIKNKAT